ncbi:MAG: HAMP domain-containing protein [Deltaproteobacteria bacterium]|nr:HAMP domain-containing protein [Deltaproteobacteria bacterium]
MKIPLRYKFFLSSALIALLAVVLSYAFGSGYLIRDKEAYAFETAAEAAESHARKIADYLDARFKVLDVARGIAGSASLGPEQKKDLVRALVSASPDMSELSVTGPTGEIMRITAGGAAAARVCAAPGAPGERRGRSIVGRPADGRDLLVMSAAYEGEVRGACMAAWADAALPPAGLFDVWVFRDDGHDLMPSVRSDERAREAVRRRVTQRPAAVRRGTFNLGGEGPRLIGAFSAVPGFGAVVAAAVPEEKVLGAVRDLERNLAIVAAIAIAIAGLLSTVIAARMTRSIAVLENAAAEISRGNFDQQIALWSRDELEDLAEALSRMSTELRAREHALKDANVRLVQAEKLAAFGQLGAGIAHEIKNPLTGMLGYVQLSQRVAGREGKVGEYLKTVEGEILRCKGIIDDLLKFSRQDRSAKGPIVLGEVLAGAAKLVRHQLMLMGVEIGESYDTGTLQAWGNANQIQQVALNLILNAGQACAALKSGGAAQRKFRVDVSCRAEGGAAVFEIADNGTGIPPAAAARVFEPFFTTKPEGQGTGLGLSVSYGIIKEHQGEITFETRVGEGTTFRVRLPAVVPASTAANA